MQRYGRLAKGHPAYDEAYQRTSGIYSTDEQLYIYMY